MPELERSLPPAVAGRAFLRDGTEVWVRPVHEADRDLVNEFVNAVSFDALELRYFEAIRPSAAREEIVEPHSPDDRLCLLVLGERTERVAVLGVGEYATVGGNRQLAEVAFLVAEPFRGRGIASLLLARLARAAGSFGIERFVARVRDDNPEMLEVFRGTGIPLSERREGDEVDVIFPIAPRGSPAAAGRSVDPARAETVMVPEEAYRGPAVRRVRRLSRGSRPGTPRSPSTRGGRARRPR
jgi:GNAT superfamily N-acetyltransferase